MRRSKLLSRASGPFVWVAGFYALTWVVVMLK
jgi:hypothetical protein